MPQHIAVPYDHGDIPYSGQNCGKSGCAEVMQFTAIYYNLLQFTPSIKEGRTPSKRAAIQKTFLHSAMDLDPKIQRVHNIAKELNNHGTIPSFHKQNLEDRLVVVWGEYKRQARTAHGRRARSEYEATYRRNQSRKKYLEVYDKNNQIFLPFILALSPRACSDFTAIDDLLQRDETQQFRLGLSLETKILLEEIAVRKGFANNPKFVAFLESLFPNDNDFELVQKIITDRGHAENPKCIEFLEILFPHVVSHNTSIQAELSTGGLQTAGQAITQPHTNGFVYSKALASYILPSDPVLSEAVQSSIQWKTERSRGDLTTDCLIIIAPNNPYEDMAIKLVIAQEHAFGMAAVIGADFVIGDSKYIYFNASASCISILGDPISEAAQSSYRWKLESYIRGLEIEIPSGLNEDASITIVIGQEKGFELIAMFGFQLIW